MNAAHVHLMVNHVPLFAALFGGAFLAFGLSKNVPALRSAGLVLGLIAGLSALAAVQSGERAEDIVEGLVNTNDAALEQHEEAAETAQWAAILLGLVSLVALTVPRERVAILTRVEWLAVVLFLVTLVMVARTAQLGGPIRHPEIGAASSAADHDPTGGKIALAGVP